MKKSEITELEANNYTGHDDTIKHSDLVEKRTTLVKKTQRCYGRNPQRRVKEKQY